VKRLISTHSLAWIVAITGAFAVLPALRARGVAEPAATLAAESGATVFGIAFAQWIREGEARSLPAIASEVLRELLNLTEAAAGKPAPG